MGLLDLIRQLRAFAQRRRIALLLVAATFVAELLDVLGEGHSAVSGGATVSGAEGLAAVAGLLTAGVLGGRIAAPTGRLRTAGLVIGALVAALLVHESFATLLQAGHGESAGELLAHVGAGVLPVALVLGLIVVLLAGVRIVRRVVAARRGRRASDLVVDAGVRRVRAPRRDVVPPGLLPALHLAGRAPPAVARG